MPHLFDPLALGPVTVPNRIAASPMCQYSADDGSATDWHLQHLMRLAIGRPGMIVVEATHVERLGRITHGCLGLYSDDNEAAIGRALAAARRVAAPGTVFSIQLAHAGRKGSAQRPWEGGQALKSGDDPWTAVAPSAVPYADGWHTPQALDAAGLERVKAAFCDAAKRAVRLGFEAIELHLAHGYLIHQFLSPLSNRREDAYGGSAENRRRFPLEVAKAVRAVVPKTIALGARISGSDQAEGGLTIEDGVAVAKALKAEGLDFVCVTSGGLVATQKIKVEPGYQVPFAAKVRAESGLVTRAVGMIVEATQADRIVSSGQADMVALARALLDDPHWVWHAAEKLGAKLTYPQQYARVAPAAWPGAAIARTTPAS